MTSPAESGLFDLEIDSFGHQGVGVGRHDGQVVFVKGALPGDRLRVRAPKSAKRFVHGDLVEVVSPSELRIEPACEMAAQGAGCCDLSHVEPSVARTLKSQVLGEQLRRIGGLDVDNPPVGPKTQSAQQLSDLAQHYRIRARCGVDDAGRVGMRDHAAKVIAGTQCRQLDHAIADGIGSVAAIPGAEIVAAVGSDGELHVVQVAGPSRRRVRGAQRRTARSGTGATEKVLRGSGLVTQHLGATTWQVPATGFWQAHRDAPGWYSELVGRVVADLPGTTLTGWDLFGGAGVLSAAQLVDPRMSTVHLVDGDGPALDAATQALPGERIQIHRGSVASRIGDLPRPDVVVSDPPRTGAGAQVIDVVCEAEPAVVVAVGCDPATFARDLADFGRGGYRPTEIVGFDAFGMTHHVEAIAVLRPNS